MSPKGTDRDRLLRLIDGAPTPVPAPVKDESASTEPKRGFLDSFSGLRKSVEAAIGGERPNNALSLANRVMAVAVVCLLIYGAVDFMKKSFSPAPAARVESETAPVMLPPAEATAVPSRGAADLEALFDSSRVQPASAGAPVAAATGFRLVGVDWGDDPVALIEDTQTGKTFFRKKGDKIGQYEVSGIERKRAFLTAGGETTEIQ